jgi:hypothetical protein
MACYFYLTNVTTVLALYLEAKEPSDDLSAVLSTQVSVPKLSKVSMPKLSKVSVVSTQTLPDALAKRLGRGYANWSSSHLLLSRSLLLLIVGLS